MSGMDIYTFKKTDGTAEVTVSVDPELTEMRTVNTCGSDPLANEGRCQFHHCPLAITIAVLLAGFGAVGWVWNTIRIRTTTLANGQVEIAAFSFDRWPVTFVIVAFLFAAVLAFRVYGRERYRMEKLAVDERNHRLDIRRDLVEKAFDFAKSEKSKTQEQNKWSIAITVNKNAENGKNGNHPDNPNDPKPDNGSPPSKPSGGPSPGIPPSNSGTSEPTVNRTDAVPGETIVTNRLWNGGVPDSGYAEPTLSADKC